MRIDWKEWCRINECLKQRSCCWRLLAFCVGVAQSGSRVPLDCTIFILLVCFNATIVDAHRASIHLALSQVL
jgi:hypothetical protein